MASFFERRGYNARTIQQDLDKMRRITQSDALQRNISLVEKESRIPLILTYHPLNKIIKIILLYNFKILSDDPETKEIFPQPPMVTYRCDQNLHNILVHTSPSNQATALSGSAPCRHPRCRTWRTTYQMKTYFIVTNVPLTSKNHSLVSLLALYTASHADAALPFTSTKLGALLGNVLENTYEALPSVRPVFLSQSTSSLTDTV